MEKAKVYYSDLRTSPTSNLFLSSTYKCNFLGADNKQ